eukprot:TRINITY_DN21775_c0_g2_i1.p1 TRINITY_DN21775_c0_g2~~TRINITY_DN21775_c0_g2_i1.p1  ORF type:complete len:632 (+),score=62.69 TRINITY_DN21775_c0_g2_i1:225-1898(+)
MLDDFNEHDRQLFLHCQDDSVASGEALRCVKRSEMQIDGKTSTPSGLDIGNQDPCAIDVNNDVKCGLSPETPQSANGFGRSQTSDTSSGSQCHADEVDDKCTGSWLGGRHDNAPQSENGQNILPVHRGSPIKESPVPRVRMEGRPQMPFSATSPHPPMTFGKSAEKASDGPRVSDRFGTQLCKAQGSPPPGATMPSRKVYGVDKMAYARSQRSCSSDSNSAFSDDDMPPSLPPRGVCAHPMAFSPSVICSLTKGDNRPRTPRVDFSSPARFIAQGIGIQTGTPKWARPWNFATSSPNLSSNAAFTSSPMDSMSTFMRDHNPVGYGASADGEAVVGDEEELAWIERQRVTGAVARSVTYEEFEDPTEDVMGFRLTSAGRYLITALKVGGVASCEGVSAGDQLISIDGRKDFYGMDPKPLQQQLQAPTTLIFLGFVGKLEAEVRVKQPDKPKCGLACEIGVIDASTARASSSVTVQVCDAVVFPKSSDSIFIQSDAEDDDISFGSSRRRALGSDETRPKYVRSEGNETLTLYELQRKDAKSLLRQALADPQSDDVNLSI